MKRTTTLSLLAIALICAAVPAFAAEADRSGLIFEVVIPFAEGSMSRALLPDGRSFDLGTVLKLPDQTRWPSYTASAWGKPGAVTASAVNAMHILMSVEDGKGRTMSVIPGETIAPAAGPGASIVLDCPAGRGVFGAWAPPVGTPITVVTPTGEHSLESGHLPSRGDMLAFRVYRTTMPYMIEFENRPGGRVTSWSEDGANLCARVIRPVGGVGRFEGTLYSSPGHIRAAHSGVIDVSTSKLGEIGGFQIIPWEHALNSKEMQGSWQLTQWLIIGAPDGRSNLGGAAPLFAGGLVPGTADGEKLWDLWSTYGRKPLVLARRDGGPWGSLPVVSGRVDDALADVTHIRIYFPFTDEPQATGY